MNASSDVLRGPGPQSGPGVSQSDSGGEEGFNHATYMPGEKDTSVDFFSQLGSKVGDSLVNVVEGEVTGENAKNRADALESTSEAVTDVGAAVATGGTSEVVKGAGGAVSGG